MVSEQGNGEEAVMEGVSEIFKERIMMERTIVLSSRIKSIGYEGQVMEVEFNSGGVYRYDNVPEEVYKGLMDAKQPGKYFDSNVKGKFDYKKIGG